MGRKTVMTMMTMMVKQHQASLYHRAVDQRGVLTAAGLEPISFTFPALLLSSTPSPLFSLCISFVNLNAFLCN